MTAGIFEHQGSTLDWCEENYIVSKHIVEVVNTVSFLISTIPIVLPCFPKQVTLEGAVSKQLCFQAAFSQACVLFIRRVS